MVKKAGPRKTKLRERVKLIKPRELAHSALQAGVRPPNVIKTTKITEAVPRLPEELHSKYSYYLFLADSFLRGPPPKTKKK